MSIQYTALWVAGAVTPISGMCVIRFDAALNRVRQAGYLYAARLVNPNQAINDELESTVIDQATGDEDGTGFLRLIQHTQFTDGDGMYEISVTSPGGTVTHKIRRTIPVADSIHFQDLLAGN